MDGNVIPLSMWPWKSRWWRPGRRGLSVEMVGQPTGSGWDTPVVESSRQPEGSGWVAVRCVFRTEDASVQTYEERVTLWRAADMDVAIELAEAEAEQYAVDLTGPPGNPTEYVGLAQAYLLADSPGHGAEVFSLIRASDLDPDAYIDAYFETGTERQGAPDSDSI